jgi:hypothetical protein
MVDSSFNPASGGQTRSNKVTYTLVSDGAGWALRMDLDAGWLGDPARVYPVVVDPTFGPEADDTFVSSNENAHSNNSGDTELLIGTYNGGVERTASYLHFDQAMASLSTTYVTSAH